MLNKSIGARARFDWPETAMKLAYNIAQYRSEDIYVQVGACVIKNDGDLVLGYNGPPPKVEINWLDRDERRPRIIHAEANALNRILPDTARLMAVTHFPCPVCINIIAQKRIKTVYYGQKLEGYNNDLTQKLADEYGIKLIQLEIDLGLKKG